MQGLFPGDLGNIGSASLNESKIYQLAGMFLSDECLERYSNYSIQSIGSGNKTRDRSRERSGNGNKRRKTADPAFIFNSLTKKERRYLEFCARVLRCAQRYSLISAERSSSGDLLQTIVHDCITLDSKGDENKKSDGLSSKRCTASIDKLSKCPWINFVMKGLCSQINFAQCPSRPKLSLGDIPNMRSNSSLKLSFTNSSTERQYATNIIASTYHADDFPMRAAMHGCLQKHNHEQSISQERVKIYLQIVAACAEVFPRGECWSSTNKWYVSKFSPLDGDPNYSIEGEDQRSYCSACSPSDLASVVHSICDILSHYGTTGGDLKIQSCAFVCLLKLTESSVIAARYWNNQDCDFGEEEERDQLPLAWQRVWDTIFRQDLRFLSYTASALSASHGELVLMLLTEIVKWSLTKVNEEMHLNGNCNASFLQKRQEQVWKLPIFKSAKRIQCSAVFEFISILLNNIDLGEGDDSFNENELREILKIVPNTLQNYDGGKRRYRITLFCLSYIASAIKRDDVEAFRRILPFVTECVAVLTRNDNISCSTTSFSIHNNRYFRVTESRYCLNENERMHDKESKFAAAWKDSIEPFWFQFTVEKNHVLWDNLNDRDIMLSPPWSMEDRNWLNQIASFNDNNTGPRTASADAVELCNIGISAILSVLGFGPQTNEVQSNKVSIVSRLSGAKFIIVVSLYNEYSMKDCSVQWRFIEEMFDSILESVIDHVGKSSQDNEILLSEMIGIFHLLRKSHLSGKCHHQVKGLFSSSKLSDFYDLCKQQLSNYEPSCTKNFRNGKKGYIGGVSCEESGIESDDDIEESQTGQFDGIYPNTSLSEPESDGDFHDSYDESDTVRSGTKRKSSQDPRGNKSSKKARKDPSTFETKSNEHNAVEELDFGATGTEVSWLCAYTLFVLNPSFEVVNIIDQSNILPEDSTEPHNYVLCFGLFYHFVPLSLKDPDDKDGYTIFSLCKDLISEGRKAASHSSPYSCLGLQACKMLTRARLAEKESLSSREIDDIINNLIPAENSPSFLRCMKTRPRLKYLQVHAGISCFLEGGDEIRNRLQMIFTKTFIVECLRSKVSMLRRLGAFAASTLLVYSKTELQNSIVNTPTRHLPPFDINPSKKSEKTFDDWVEKRVSSSGNKNLIESERTFWKTSSSILHSDTCYIMGVMMGKTTDEEMFFHFFSSLFRSHSDQNECNLLKFKIFESVAFLRKYKCLEDQLQELEFNFIRNWIADDKSLLSIPASLCPSPIRSVLRIGCVDDVNHQSLQKFVADEFVNQKASMIIPCILINQPRLEYNDEIIKKRDKLLAEVVEVCEDDSLSKLLRSHIHDIYAIIVPMMHCKTGEIYPYRKRGEDIISYLHSFPKLGHRHIARTTHQIVTQMIELHGKDISFGNDVTNSKQSIKDAIHYFTTKVLNINFNPKEGLFENSGTSTTECLLHARYLLDEASYSNGKRHAWKMIDFIVDNVQENVCANEVENPQLAFAASSLLNVLIDKSQETDLQCKALMKLKALMKAITNEQNVVRMISNDLTLVLNKLILAMIQIHEDCQHRIINFCLNIYQSESSKLLKHLTFKNLTGESVSGPSPFHGIDEIYITDPVDQAISKYGDKIPLNLVHLIETAYEVLELVLVERKEILQELYTELDPFPKTKTKGENETILMQFNKRFCLSHLLNKVDSTFGTTSMDRIYSDAKRFERIAKRFAGKNSKKSAEVHSAFDSQGLEARTLLAGIDCVKNSLSIGKNDTPAPLELNKLVVRTLSTIVKYLCDFCNDQYTLDIQVAAASCLGSLLPILHNANVDMLEIYSMQTEKRTFFQSDLFDHFFEGILKLLVDYVQSEDTETAIIAKDTLKAILNTNDGSSLWQDLKPEDSIRRFVGPFVTKEKIKLDVDRIPRRFLQQLMQCLSLNEDDIESNHSWCWSTDLWKCDQDSGVEFEDWICRVVSSMLMCCYSKESEQVERKTLIHGTSDFFRPCLKLCTSKLLKNKGSQFFIMSKRNISYFLYLLPEEYRFAEALFPAIIFDVLATDKKNSSTIFSTHKNYLVGAATSLSNQTITQCFDVVLKKPESEDDARNVSQDSFFSRSDQTPSNLDAVKAVVGVLNILRCFTEHSFYHQKHKLNKLRIQGRNYDAKKGIVKFEDLKQRTYNNLNSSIPFHGRPYGVVLDVQDMDIANSYLQLKDYATAMYYAENFADNRLGGSACSFEMYPFREIKQVSLSGFGQELESIDSKEAYLLAVDYHHILKQCYAALHEEDNLKGLEEQTSKLRFEKPECFKDEVSTFRDPTEKSLMIMDSASQIDSGRGIPNPRNQAAVLSSLSNLSLRDTARHYIAGLCVSQGMSTFTSTECSYVKDKWAEETWRMLQWDDTLLPQNVSAALSKPVHQPLTHDKDFVRKALRNSGHDNIKVGFNEALSNLFFTVLREDMSQFSNELYQTRATLLEDFNRDVGSKPSNGLFSHSLKFMAINEIEDLGAVISGILPSKEYLDKWCSTPNNIYENVNVRYSFNDIESAMACREISLKFIFRKFGTDSDDHIGHSYLRHLKQTCTLAREYARPNLATGALERMRRFLDLTCNVEENTLSNKIKVLSMNLEEARILHSNGNTTAAVRTCKLIISSIDQMSLDESEELSFLNGETLLQCGTWLIKHKIDAAAIVLNKYVRRAAQQAQEIHKNHHSARSTELLSSTHFVLAEFVANLYDSVEKRVNSQEWKSLGNVAEGRKKELDEVTKLIRSCKKSTHKSKKSHEINLRIEQGKLKKEVEMDLRERNAVEESVESYLRLAIRAYGVALSHCTELSLHSKHVFRLVSLWFRNANGEGKGGDINSLIASDVTCIIPRYVSSYIYLSSSIMT